MCLVSRLTDCYCERGREGGTASTVSRERRGLGKNRTAVGFAWLYGTVVGSVRLV